MRSRIAKTLSHPKFLLFPDSRVARLSISIQYYFPRRLWSGLPASQSARPKEFFDGFRTTGDVIIGAPHVAAIMLLHHSPFSLVGAALWALSQAMPRTKTVSFSARRSFELPTTPCPASPLFEAACLHAKALGQRRYPLAFAPAGMLSLACRM